jgi:hypothetical protein
MSARVLEGDMAELNDEALEAVKALEDADDEELFRQLGLRVAAIQRDPAIAGRFAPTAAELEPKGIALGDVVAMGRKAFGSISKAGYGLLCSGDPLMGSHFDSFVATLGTNRLAITAALATLLVAQIGFAPAIAGVVATLAIGKAAPASVDKICATWAAKAGYSTTPPTTTEPTVPTATTTEPTTSTPAPNPEATPAPNPEPTAVSRSSGSTTS